jgi:maleylpyruvate isomerase
MTMKLYNFWRSSCSWRVRIALHLKQIPFEYVPVSLTAGEQFAEDHKARNPTSKVPVLEPSPGVYLTESMAILEYLEETHPAPSLLPKDALGRARVRALAEIVNSGIQPFQNTSVQKYVKRVLDRDEKAWNQHWIGLGLRALEQAVRPLAGQFCVGDAVTLADLLLVPQLYGARRFEVDLADMPTLVRVEQACAALPAFAAAHADAQPDKPKE